MNHRFLWRLVLVSLLFLALFSLAARALADEPQGIFIQPTPATVWAGDVFTVTTRINIYPEENPTFFVEFPLSEEVEFVDADPGFVYKPLDPAVPFSFNSVSGTITGPTTVTYRLRLLPNTPRKAVLLYARIFFEGKLRFWQMGEVIAIRHPIYLPLTLR